MTAHTCSEITPGCYRCDLNIDEMIEGLRYDIEMVVRYFDTNITPYLVNSGVPEYGVNLIRSNYIRGAFENDEAMYEIIDWDESNPEKKEK